MRFLGDWVRCDGQDRELVEVVDVHACLALCNAREDCTAIEEHFWFGIPLCTLITSPCETTWTESYFEEDAARAYRKECCGWDADILAPHASPDGFGFVVDPASGCRFEPMDEMCESYHEPQPDQAGGATLVECIEACQARDDCRWVTDPFLEGDKPHGHECILYTSECDRLVANAVPAHHYRKVCQDD